MRYKEVDMADKSILLVEDDTELCALMTDFFSQHQFSLEAAHDGRRGLSRALEGNFDLVILDVMLPTRDGLEVLTALRQRGFSVPVLMLTSKDTVEDRVRGLDVGADDYLVKPFPYVVLLARLRALLRRGPARMASVLQRGPLRLDPASHDCRRGLEVLDLTPREFALQPAVRGTASPGC